MKNTEKVTFKIIYNGCICVLKNRKSFYETSEEAIFEAKKFKNNPKEMFPQLTDELVKKYKNTDFLIFDSKNQHIATV